MIIYYMDLTIVTLKTLNHFQAIAQVTEFDLDPVYFYDNILDSFLCDIFNILVNTELDGIVVRIVKCVKLINRP